MPDLKLPSRARCFAAVVLAALLPTVAAGAEPKVATETAEYRVQFRAAWSSTTHPIDFPGGRAHFSGLIGGVHDDTVAFWTPGTVASEGIERMAEVGATSPLDNEVRVAIDAGAAREIIRGGAIAVSPGNASATFTVSQQHPLISLVSMIAPSPDWFVGVRDLSLFDGGDWSQQVVVDLFAYDAGTDSGSSFTSSDADTNPPDVIRRIESGSLGNGVPLGTFTFTRLDTPPAPPLDLRDGRFRVTVEWRDTDQRRGVGQPLELTDDSGTFWFFDAANVEVLVKVLDGCAING
ncbi:MAG: spondin domain-containing protein, partial [Acidobacteriota bacterium]